jgi:hypothetical protein
MESLLDELKLQSLYWIFQFKTYPPVFRPIRAIERIARDPENAHGKQDRMDKKEWDEYHKKESDAITKAGQIIQILVSPSVFAEYKRKLNEISELKVGAIGARAKKPSNREAFADSIDSFVTLFSGPQQLQRVMTMLTREMAAIPAITEIHDVNVLIQLIYSKMEQHERIANIERSKEYKLGEISLQATLFSKLQGRHLATTISLLHVFCMNEANSGRKRNFTEITRHLKEAISHHDLDGEEQKQAYATKSVRTVDSLLTVNSSISSGTGCFNCKKLDHNVAQCSEPKCYKCESSWPSTSALGYHHPFACALKVQRSSPRTYGGSLQGGEAGLPTGALKYRGGVAPVTNNQSQIMKQIISQQVAQQLASQRQLSFSNGYQQQQQYQHQQPYQPQQFRQVYPTLPALDYRGSGRGGRFQGTQQGGGRSNGGRFQGRRVVPSYSSDRAAHGVFNNGILANEGQLDSFYESLDSNTGSINASFAVSDFFEGGDFDEIEFNSTNDGSNAEVDGFGSSY